MVLRVAKDAIAHTNSDYSYQGIPILRTFRAYGAHKGENGSALLQLWSSLDIALGIAILVSSIERLAIHIDINQIMIFLSALLVSTVILYYYWLLLIICAFWFVRAESMLAIFQNMYQTGRWPISIYLSALLADSSCTCRSGNEPARCSADRSSYVAGVAGLAALALAMLLVTLKRYSAASF